MGQYLSAPVTQKETLAGQTECLRFGISSHQGWRKSQEDAHIAHHYNADCHVFGVFDGHGGPEVAKFCSKYLPGELQAMLEQGTTPDECLVQVFHRMDELMRSQAGYMELDNLRRAASAGEGAEEQEEDTYDMLRKLVALQRMMGQQQQAAATAAAGGAPQLEGAPAAAGSSSGGGSSNGLGASTPASLGTGHELTIQAGCTAVVALLRAGRLYVANAGDSRAVLCQGRQALALSEDHKPAAAMERARIVAAGGFLSEIGGITRVNGNLNLSRAIGDLRYKMNSQLHPRDQIITAEPDIRQIQLGPDDRFLVLACDGIWDVMSNQEVVDFVVARLDRGVSPTETASELLNACLASNPREARGIGCDNMTAAIIIFEAGTLAVGQACGTPTQQPAPASTATLQGAPPDAAAGAKEVA